MAFNTLYNVTDPVNPQDVATKEYADNVRGGGWVILNWVILRMSLPRIFVENSGGVFEARNGGHDGKGAVFIGSYKIGGVRA